MAQTPEDSGDDSRLELPSLSIFRRRKKKSAAGEPPADSAHEPPEAPEAPEAPETSEASETSETSEPRAELGSEADEPDVDEPEPAPQPAAAAETPVEAEAPPTDVIHEDPGPEAETANEPKPGADAGSEPEPDAEDENALGTMFPSAVDESEEPADEPTQVLPTTPAEPHEGDYGDDDDAVDEQRDDTEEVPVAGKEPRERKPLRLPALDGRIAAPLTGIVVGLAGVALTFAGTRGCEAVKGTGSCGGVGLFLLIAILALMVLLGAALLKAWQLSDPTNSSLLAVGLVAVLTMLFLLPSIDQWYMVIVIPVLSALMYLLTWWVNHTFIENADGT